MILSWGCLMNSPVIFRMAMSSFLTSREAKGHSVCNVAPELSEDDVEMTITAREMTTVTGSRGMFSRSRNPHAEQACR